MNPSVTAFRDVLLAEHVRGLAADAPKYLSALVLVYSVPTGRTGFDTDDCGKGLAHWLVRGGHLFDHTERHFKPVPAGDPGLAALRGNLQPAALVVVDPDPEARAWFDSIDQYLRAESA